jgi:F-type H+-transporting ATPase subunit epsilon
MAQVYLEIVTPEKIAYASSVDHVILPTQDGEIDILPGHIPLITMAEPGSLRFQREGKTEDLAIDRGFIEVRADKVSVLTEQAIQVESVDPQALEDARRKAEEALLEAKEKGLDPELLEELETKARFLVAQQIVQEKRKAGR